ncbi:MAG: Hsp20 family protein [Candidatus Altiarchaeales archaeon]|nr:Hsp20 family protein [Candidatus Altiarchaeales archaeon]
MDMFPWDKKPTRRPKTSDVKAFETEIRRLQDEMHKALNEGRDFGFGFSMTQINGQPVKHEIFYPNQTQTNEDIEDKTCTPFSDVYEEENQTRVVFDLPGVDKKDIQLTQEHNTLEVSVETPQRSYHKKVKLRHEIQNPKTTYKNGVLEVRIPKAEPKNLKIN